MTNILRIDASARQNRSLTRKLADTFFEAWLTQNPDDQITIRDVGASPPLPISEEWIAAAFSPEPNSEERTILALSDILIDEIVAADIIVIASPMYNYGMPSALKAWFDQVIRVDKTFTFDLARGDRPLEPTHKGKTLVILTATGEFGFDKGGLNESSNHLVPHIETCAKYLGAEKVHHIGIEYQEFGDHRHKESVAASRRAADKLVRDLQLAIPATEHS